RSTRSDESRSAAASSCAVIIATLHRFRARSIAVNAPRPRYSSIYKTLGAALLDQRLTIPGGFARDECPYVPATDQRSGGMYMAWIAKRLGVLTAVVIAAGALQMVNPTASFAANSGTCSGGSIAAGSYKSLTITGPCALDAGNVTVAQNVT